MRRLLLAAALVGFAGSAHAGLTSTWTVASDYLFDGVSLTQGDPALQVSLDYGFANGFYIGTWASNVDFGEGDPADVEIDYYGGYSTSYESGWGWTAGFASYTYTGEPGEYDYTELTAGVTFPTGTTLQVWAADDDSVFGGYERRAKVKHGFDLGDDWTLLLEGTRTVYEQSDVFEDFTHGQIGVSKGLGGFTAYLGYSDTTRDDDLADGTVLFTLAYTFTLIE